MIKIEKLFKRKGLKKIAFLLILILGIPVFLYQQNNMITTTNIIVESNRLPERFDGYRILHLSDLHSKSFGENQKYLVNKVKKAQPDIIVFTGDLIDSRRYNEEHSIILMEELAKITEVYYVNGNHEARRWNEYPNLEKTLQQMGVKVLRNTHLPINRDGDQIYIIGIDDPNFDYAMNREGKSVRDVLEINRWKIDEAQTNSFKILLSHRPELFSLYVESNIDITFSGHAHGGQIRLPFIGGLFSPGQGFLPKYSSGKYEEKDSTLIVSRGLGNSIFPQRLFNRPEIIVVELKNK
ncbi:metallophosphoesterase [Alkaliphilus hydrothermalis]|uniref:MPP superfamily phosphohydrolase n=1 Tax=Alkaliphilus hydrothermalis TaxID=1482730 RepID=A0ABS2NTG3_9FIRM|nr:metallophosphoesterase [Alkaliphilus hydrothermalis]MBM7616116.1 putative MPP superfamily phosphohydrolase [Alkaliphilus hydrothermalis]